MANEVARATQNFFEKYGAAASPRRIVGDLLLFNKFGEWVYGRDKTKLPMGTALAACMHTLEVGWVFWEAGHPVDYEMGFLANGFVPKKRNELGDTDQTKWELDDGEPKDPWQFSNSLVLVDVKTEALYTFSTSTKGGLGAIGELSENYGKHIRQKPDEMPIIELGVSSYVHSNRKYGEIRIPILKRVDWIAIDKLPLIEGAPSIEPAVGTDEPKLALPEPKSTSPTKKNPRL
jgi:hypothetical protein